MSKQEIAGRAILIAFAVACSFGAGWTYHQPEWYWQVTYFWFVMGVAGGIVAVIVDLLP